MGFAANNVLFGVGAFCFHALFDPYDCDGNSKMTVLTRDTFGMAMKATYGEFGGKSLFIYKDPKTDKGNLKKSQKGCCVVSKSHFNSFECRDQFTWDEARLYDDSNALQLVFRNGEILKTETFAEIRGRMYD
jgi:nicotinamide phosphoribosyltransferase